MTGSFHGREKAQSDHEARGRRRRLLVTAAAGFGVAGALIVGTNSSSALPSVSLYDSWLTNARELVSAQPARHHQLTEVSDDQIADRRTTEAGADADREERSESDVGDSRDETVVLAGAKPTSVSIPSMGVQASVIPVGLDDGGGVFVPEDVHTLGWYTASVPVAADRGSAVIVGHRDSAVQGAGAFSGIENLAEGEEIEVETEPGRVETYVVEEVRLVAKSDFASIANEAFAMNGGHRLTLITCGGEFDSAAGSYLSNVFVIAMPSRT